MHLAPRGARQRVAVRSRTVSARAPRHVPAVVVEASARHGARGRDTPRYFEALAEERSIAAHDARTDPRTSEFEKNYLVPNGITSMLDAPIVLGGKLVGVVCNEHVGPARRWAPWEELLAGTLADFVAMALGSAERVAQARALEEYRDKLEDLVAERTRQLEESEKRFHLLFDAAPVALVLSRTADNHVVAANPRAAAIFGVEPQAAAGQHAPDFWIDLEARARLMTLLEEKGMVESFEGRLKQKDGRPFWGAIAARTLVLGGGESSILFGVRDVTAQKEAEERLRLLASTDELTGALNRRTIFEVANDEIGRAVAADLVLLAHRVARARERVQAIDLVRNGSRVPLTMSAGVVALRPEEDLGAFFRRADAALYEAKSSGRNRVVVGS